MVLPQIVSIGIYNSQKAMPSAKISKKRKTNMFEIELPCDNGGISYINESFSPINENMIICAKPGQTRHTKFPFKCYYIHMILEDGILYDTLMNTPNFFETNRREYFEKIFTKLCKYYSTGVIKDEIVIQSLILELIYSISKETSKFALNDGIKSNNYLVIDKTLKYIKENLSGELTLEKIADFAALSPIHFHNLFKTSVGKTLRDYVEEQRIKKAVNLLISTNLSLTEIALQCGFSSQSYFSYVFKRRMKTTPRKYAQEIYKKYETN